MHSTGIYCTSFIGAWTFSAYLGGALCLQTNFPNSHFLLLRKRHSCNSISGGAAIHPQNVSHLVHLQGGCTRIPCGFPSYGCHGVPVDPSWHGELAFHSARQLQCPLPTRPLQPWCGIQPHLPL